MNTKPNSYLNFLDDHERYSYLDYKNSKATIWFIHVISVISCVFVYLELSS